MKKSCLRKIGILFSLIVIVSCFDSNVFAQNIVVKTESEDSDVFLNNVKRGSGSKVNVTLDKKIKVQQLKVERKGYKTEYTTVNSSDDIVSVKNNSRYAIKDDGLSRIVVTDFSIANSLDKVEINLFDYDKYRKGKIERLGFCECQDMLGFKSLNYDIGLAFKNAVLATGYVDTNVSVLGATNNKLFMKAKMFGLEFTSMQTNTCVCKTNCITMKTQIEYEFRDIYNNLVLSKMVESSSGIFNLEAYKWFTAHGGVQSELVNFAIGDAIEKGFLDVVMDPTSLRLFKEEEKLASKEMPKLSLTTTASVVDLPSARLATVTVKTKDGFGSGCVVSNDGYILSSYHVVAGLEGSKVSVVLNTGENLDAIIERTSKQADLVLLKVDKKMPFAFKILVDSMIEVTDEVYAVGTPALLDLKQTISNGIISGFRKDANGLSLIQTDVPVSPGNSGGPLLKKNGVFVGVVSSKVSGGGTEGLAFCTPSKDIITFLNIMVK